MELICKNISWAMAVFAMNFLCYMTCGSHRKFHPITVNNVGCIKTFLCAKLYVVMLIGLEFEWVFFFDGCYLRISAGSCCRLFSKEYVSMKEWHDLNGSLCVNMCNMVYCALIDLIKTRLVARLCIFAFSIRFFANKS